MNITRLHVDQMQEFCKQYRVRSLAAFGSVLRDDFNSQSDIDFLVDFEENDPFVYANLYFQFKKKLEALFNRRIDLVEKRAIKNSYFKKELEETKKVIYGQSI